MGSTVVFDGYPEYPTTKSEEQERRAAKEGCIDINVEPEIITSIPQQKFLSNQRNKIQFISLLCKDFQECGIVTVQAESDADRIMVQHALAASRISNSSAVLVGEDTDLLVLLLHHRENEEVYMLKPGRTQAEQEVWSVKHIQESLQGFHKYLLFYHAFSGCDTTSAFFRKGKKIAWNTLKKCNETFLNSVQAFYQENASVDCLAEIGDEFVRRMYGAKDGIPLTKLRHQLYQRTIAKQALTADFDLAVLPPAACSTRQHCLRVYYQVCKKIEKFRTIYNGWR